MNSNFVARARLLLTAACAVVFALAPRQPAAAQGRPTADPALNRRMENERNVRDQQRVLRGMEIDSETRNLSKEERQKRAAEDFMRLKVLHNEITELTAASTPVDRRLAAEKAADARLRAAHLRADLVLPEAAKDEKPKQAEGGPAAATTPPDDAQLNASLARLCELIRSFVSNLNDSPNDSKAAARARLDLDRIVELGDEIAARTVPPPQKPTN